MVVLHKPARFELVLPPGHALSARLAAGLLLLIWVPALMVATAIQANNAPGHPARFIADLLALAALFASWRVARAWRAVMHIQLNRNQIEVSQTFRGRRIGRVRTASLHRHGITVEAKRDEKVWSVALPPIGGLRIACSGEREARWLATMLERAASPDEHPNEKRCVECGAPLSIPLDVEATGAVTCGFCGTAYELDAVAIRREPVRLPHLPLVGDDVQTPSIAVAQQGGWLRFQLVPPPLPSRAFLGSVSLVVAFVALDTLARLLGVASIMLPALFGDSSGVWAGLLLLGAVMAVAALGLVVIAFVAAVLTLDAFAGRREIGLGPGSLYCTPRVDVSRSLGRTGARAEAALDGFDTRAAPGSSLGVLRHLVERARHVGAQIAGRRFPLAIPPVSRGLPLLRLSEVRIAQGQGTPGVTTLVLVTPVRTARVGWILPPEEDRWLQTRLVTALAERLEALDRETRMLPTEEP